MANKKTNKKGFLETFIKDSTESVKDISKNIADGASLVGEKVKETATKAFNVGSQVVEETGEKIQHYTETRSLNKELELVESRQNEIALAFGKATLAHYLKEDSLHKSFLTTKKVDDLVVEFISNEKQIKKLKKDIKKLENQ